MKRILEKVGYRYQSLGLGKVLINKNERNVYIEVVGKNLPYIGRHGEEIFPWETYIQPQKLDKIEREAKKYDAEGWIAFCYAILMDKYKCYFSTTITLNDVVFGVKLIKTSDYRKHMKLRSPSWRVVYLPREKVTRITCNPEGI